MEEDDELVMSPLCRSVTSHGHTVQIDIYRCADTEWTLEAIDVSNNSTVWDDEFPTDQAALDEALRTLRVEGVGSLVFPPGRAA